MPAEGGVQASGGDKGGEQPKKHPEYNQKCADEYVALINGHVKEEATKDIQKAIKLCERLEGPNPPFIDPDGFEDILDSTYDKVVQLLEIRNTTNLLIDNGKVLDTSTRTTMLTLVEDFGKALLRLSTQECSFSRIDWSKLPGLEHLEHDHKKHD